MNGFSGFCENIGFRKNNGIMKNNKDLFIE